MGDMMLGHGADGPLRWGSNGGAADGVLVPVPEDECSLVVTDSYAGRLMGAVVESGTPSMAPTATAAPTPATTAASSVDLKGLARPD
eukprot:15925909-Heterocapsa_arctica.AAC.1